jgi:hypothetical protein
VAVRRPPGLGVFWGRLQPVPIAGKSGANGDDGTSDDHVRAGDEEISSLGVACSHEIRNDIEHSDQDRAARSTASETVNLSPR